MATATAASRRIHPSKWTIILLTVTQLTLTVVCFSFPAGPQTKSAREIHHRQSNGGPSVCFNIGDESFQCAAARRPCTLEPDRDEIQVSRARFLSMAASAVVWSTVVPSDAHASTTLPTDKTSQKPSSSSLPIATDQESKTLQESISGFVAGGALTVTKTLVKYPLDTATVRLQMPATTYSIRDPLRLFAGSFDGVLVPLISNIPAGGVFFAVKDATKTALKAAGAPKWARTILAVAAAQFPYWIVRNPSEVVKTRQQAGIEGYGDGVSALDAFRSAFEEAKAQGGNSTIAGVEGFYSGYFENIAYAYPADVIKFVCYDVLTQGRKDLAPSEGAIAGAMSTAVAQLLTTPLDVVRNRVMAGGTPKGDEEKPSYVDSLIRLGREEGLLGLFAGAAPRVGKAILSGAIQFATYEETKQTINGFLDRRSR